MKCRKSREQGAEGRKDARFAMKWFFSQSLGILLATALTVAAGCSDKPQNSPQSKPSGQKSGDAKNLAVKPVETKPTETKPTETKPTETKPTETK
ncbi:MAG: hypothetical protein WCJ35_21850, partial [Planctomycetota bacterium]